MFYYYVLKESDQKRTLLTVLFCRSGYGYGLRKNSPIRIQTKGPGIVTLKISTLIHSLFKG